MHPFEKLYGQPARVLKDQEDATKVILVDWMEGLTTLELGLIRLGFEVVNENSTHQTGEPWLQVVQVSFWDSALAA